LDYDKADIRIYNINGTVFGQHTIDGNFAQIDLSNYSNGIYILFIQTPLHTFSKRIIVQ